MGAAVSIAVTLHIIPHYHCVLFSNAYDFSSASFFFCRCWKAACMSVFFMWRCFHAVHSAYRFASLMAISLRCNHQASVFFHKEGIETYFFRIVSFFQTLDAWERASTVFFYFRHACPCLSDLLSRILLSIGVAWQGIQSKWVGCGEGAYRSWGKAYCWGVCFLAGVPWTLDWDGVVGVCEGITSCLLASVCPSVRPSVHLLVL